MIRELRAEGEWRTADLRAEGWCWYPLDVGDGRRYPFNVGEGVDVHLMFGGEAVGRSPATLEAQNEVYNRVAISCSCIVHSQTCFFGG